MLTRTVAIPSGTRLVGETCSQFAASSPDFSDASFVRQLRNIEYSLIDEI